MFARKSIVFALLILSLLIFVCSCSNGGINVSINACDGMSVVGKSTIRVNPGESAKFSISLNEEYAYIGNDSGAVYDSSTGSLTISNVFEEKIINVTLAKKTDCLHISIFNNNENCSVNIDSDTEYFLSAVDVNLTAECDENYYFVGWSENGFELEGGTIISTEKAIKHHLDSNYSIYANFIAANEYTIKYHTNGGKVVSTGSDTYIVNGTFSEVYAMQQTLHSNNTFEREGYIPIGYSTSPVEYEAYNGVNDIPGFSNMGGVCQVPQNHNLDLYIVWAKVTDSSKFETENGRITKYNGEDEIIVIPEYINGVPVTEIAENAIVDAPVKRIVLSKNLTKVEKSALVNCANLTEVVFFDTMLYIYDKSFDGCKDSIVTMCLNAAHLPKHSGTIEGSFCIKYERLRTLTGKKIVFVAGSNVLYGIDSALVEENFPGYSAVNYGTNGSCCALAFLEVIAKYTVEGDIVVNCPEMWSSSQLGYNVMTWEVYRSNEQCYDFFRDLDARNYTSLFDAYTYYTTGYSAYPMTPAIALEEKPYQLPETNINKYGDITYEYSKTEYDVVAGDSKLTVLSLSKDNLNKVYQMIIDNGGMPMYSFSTYNFARMVYSRDENGNYIKNKGEMSASNLAAFRKNCDTHMDYVKSVLIIPVISDVADYIMNSRYFSNSDYHCTTSGSRCGRIIRTEQIIKDIKNYLKISN